MSLLMRTLFIGESRFIATARIKPLQCVVPINIGSSELFCTMAVEKRFDRIVTFFGEKFLADHPDIKAIIEYYHTGETVSGIGKGFRLQGDDWLAELVDPNRLNPFEIFALANASHVSVSIPAIPV